MMEGNECAGPILAIDPGQKRIGVAVSDQDALIALPVATIEATGQELTQLVEMVRARNVKTVVVGLPKSMNGQDGPQAHQSRELAARLRDNLNVPVVLVDERLTTSEAMNVFKITGLKTRKQKPVVDQAAATLLLQGYLDSRRTTARTAEVSRGLAE